MIKIKKELKPESSFQTSASPLPSTFSPLLSPLRFFFQLLQISAIIIAAIQTHTLGRVMHTTVTLCFHFMSFFIRQIHLKFHFLDAILQTKGQFLFRQFPLRLPASVVLIPDMQLQTLIVSVDFVTPFIRTLTIYFKILP